MSRQTTVAAIAILVLGLFLISFGVLGIVANWPSRSGRAACRHYKFDYITLIGQAQKSSERAKALAAEAKASDANLLTVRRAAYFDAVSEALDKLVPLIETQVEVYGADYSCLDTGISFFLHDLNYPTFESLEREKEIRFLKRQVEQLTENKTAVWLGFAESFIGAGAIILAAWIARPKRNKQS